MLCRTQLHFLQRWKKTRPKLRKKSQANAVLRKVTLALLCQWVLNMTFNKPFNTPPSQHLLMSTNVPRE